MKVTHTKSNVIQYNEYYPFGLQTNTSWTRENVYGNAYLYNGPGELNNTTKWYETMFRGYDAALGRFMQVDPMASAYAMWSPYNYGANNPVTFNDPTGLYPQWYPEFPAPVGSIEGRLFKDPTDYGWYNRGSGHGHSGGMGQSMSAGDFIGQALYGNNSGGTWSDGYGYFFQSDAEAVGWAANNFSSFQGTEPNAYAMLMGIVHNRSWVHDKYEFNVTSRNGSNVRFKYLGYGQTGPDPFRKVFGVMSINGRNQFAFSYNTTDESGKYVANLGGVPIGYDYNPRTFAKTNPVILTKSLDLSRFNNTSGKLYPNYLVEAFKWGDLTAAFGQYTKQVWDSFKNGRGQVWELRPTYTIIGSTTYDITTYRFIATIPFQRSNITFFVDVMDYTPR
ncbi:MAG: hypothetical protein KF845_10430 [Cyclobacteriaceae bacterium]|nr:hypothetical protein [Cyclobacteriaceae bacterium]